MLNARSSDANPEDASFGGALLSNNWPPHWTRFPLLGFALPIIVLVMAAVLFMIYLRWQLWHRRFAAVRLAATEQVLASWSCRHPSPSDLQPATPNEQRNEECCLRQYIWPSRSISVTRDVIMQELPQVFAAILILIFNGPELPACSDGC